MNEAEQERIARAVLPATAPRAELLQPWTGPYEGVPPWDKVTAPKMREAILEGIELQRADIAAIANPLAGRLARAALATATARVDLAELARYRDDDLAWEARIDQLKQLRATWQRQGVLAMLHRWLHEMELPARLLSEIGGERVLTNLLHLAELLQNASLQQEGEQALIRWLAEQIANPSGGGDEAIVRLESDADLVKIVTIHKSKGLEYPLVFLPFAVDQLFNHVY